MTLPEAQAAIVAMMQAHGISGVLISTADLYFNGALMRFSNLQRDKVNSRR